MELKQELLEDILENSYETKIKHGVEIECPVKDLCLYHDNGYCKKMELEPKYIDCCDVYRHVWHNPEILDKEVTTYYMLTGQYMTAGEH